MKPLTRQDKIDFIKYLWNPAHTSEGREMLLTALCRAWEYLPDRVIDELYNLEYWKENK